MKWNEKLGDYLIDVSKYTITGVVLTAFFNDIANKTALYSVGVIVSMCALYVGIRISDKDEDKNKPKSVIMISLCRTAKRNPLIFPI